MRRFGLKIFCVGLPFLAGCSLLPDKPEPAPAATLQAAPPTPLPEQEALPYPPLPPATRKPTPKPRPSTTSKVSKTPPGKSAPTVPNAESSTPRTESSARKTTQAPSNVKGPEWLQYCSSRQQSNDAILCDANTLLAHPSAKVQVYVREPALARDTPEGKIMLREGLPKLYRFFVLP